jgi:hypothetical protein
MLIRSFYFVASPFVAIWDANLDDPMLDEPADGSLFVVGLLKQKFIIWFGFR